MKHSKQTAKNILLLFSFFLLAGCGRILNPYEEHFKCKTPAEDGKCVDTPTAYLEARHPVEKSIATEGCKDCEGTADFDRPPTPRQNIQDARYRILSDLLEEPDKPLLQPPKILRVLMLPYEGEQGELFMTRYVYIQVEDAKWLLTEQHEKGVR